MLRRIGFLLAFVLTAIPLMLVMIFSMLVAFGGWLCDGGEHDQILLNPVAKALTDFPFWVLGKPLDF